MAIQRKATSKSPAAASDAIDRQLARYQGMRDFKITPEPRGKTRTAKAGSKKFTPRQQQLPFVIQKHAASHLHYDFRLGWNGVLKSWAVAKGPSYFPGDKRLAVQVEDHPMEYGGFEGIIPKGQYGGGTVMLWDQGTWEPQPGHTDVDEGLRNGSLKFTLHGAKMKGKWTLVRMGGKAANERQPNWLLIKEHDGLERTSTDPSVTEAELDSVVTGRDMDEIARNEDHVWDSKKTAKDNAWYRNKGTPVARKKSVAMKPGTIKAKRGAPGEKRDVAGQRVSRDQPEFSAILARVLRKAPKEKFPSFIAPQLALQSTQPPNGAGWLHELKLDGYRIQAHKDGKNIQLLTRTGLDWTPRMKAVAERIQDIPAKSAILDGEVVVLAANGTTSFADLQAAFQEGVKKPLTYFVFDLLHLNGHNLRDLPLTDRKALLAKLLKETGDLLRFSEHLETDGAAVFQKACELHAEGIVSKRAASKYVSGRSRDWLKHKCVHEQEFVIGGFTLPSNAIHGIGALLLGYYKNDRLMYAGRTGTGFTQKTHRILRNRLEELRQTVVPFDKPPGEARRGAIWVKPKLVAQVNFAAWTADGLVRQASFKGLREDKAASEVYREEPTVTPRPRAARHALHATAKAVAAKTIQSRPAKKSTIEHAPIRLTHPEKILDVESHLTKQQLANYYWAIAPHMLPHITNRPLSLVRCPEGSGKPCFYQKHANHGLLPGIESIDVPDKKTGKEEPYIALSTAKALAGLAQMGVLEIHPWGSTSGSLERPDHIIFDLDPDAAISWRTLANSAAEVRKQLKKIGMESFLKSTGGKGLHIVIPLKPEYDWAIIKRFAHTFALRMEKQQPTLYVTKMSKAARKGRIYIDYLRNERGATAVAVFSPRARAGVPVSLPLSWSELKVRERPVFQLAHFHEWKRRLTRDPWKGLLRTRQRLTAKNLKAF